MLRVGGRDPPHPLWPAAGYLRQNGYRGVVANKPRNRRGAGPARSGASGRPAPASAGAVPGGAAPASSAPASSAPAGTAQLTAPPAAEEATYPGQGLGLPERGPGSVASMPRRIL